jgi:hypothetical protein
MTTLHVVHTKVEEEDRHKRLEHVSSGEEQKVEPSRLKSRVVWLYKALEASSHTGKPAPALERVREVAGVIRVINRDRSEDPNPFDTTRLPGQYTWKLDQALPGKHTTAVRVAYVGPGINPHLSENSSLPAELVPIPSRTGGRC